MGIQKVFFYFLHNSLIVIKYGERKKQINDDVMIHVDNTAKKIK